MKILVVGDVHGCLHTFKTLLSVHWNPVEDLLVQVGDLIDRGNFSAETVGFVRRLQTKYPDRVIILRGNHEQEIIHHIETRVNKNWLLQGGYETLANYQKLGMSLAEEVDWMKCLPLYWENSAIFVSHAGIAEVAENPFFPDAKDSVLWTRKPLRNLGKLQVVGHTPMRNGLPKHDPISNSWYIDTGAYLKKNLSAIQLTQTGDVLKVVSIPTNPQDV